MNSTATREGSGNRVLVPVPPVFIVVVSYNTRELTRRCLVSLAALEYPAVRIVLVDNGSCDETEAMVQQEFPSVVVIQTGGNRGYTGGNNRGIEYSLQEGADYILLLNPDTIVSNGGFLSSLVEYMESHPEAGIVGPRVFLRLPGIIQNTVLYPPSLWRSLFHWPVFRLAPQVLERSGDRVVRAPVLNGVCLLIRAHCLRQIGLFDERIFMYVEDADLDYRAWKNGWGVVYVPIDSVVHLQKETGYHMTGTVSFLLRRNSVYYLVKTGRRFEALGYAVLSVLLMAVRGALSPRRVGMREAARFCRRLVQAYAAILFERPFDERFGPPFDSAWRPVRRPSARAL